MPIYEYQCSKCGEIFEAFQKISEKPLSQCRYCKGKVEKLISQSSFQLKGTGWYLTDYAQKSQSSRSDANSDSKTTAKTEKKNSDGGSKSSGTEKKVS